MYRASWYSRLSSTPHALTRSASHRHRSMTDNFHTSSRDGQPASHDGPDRNAVCIHWQQLAGRPGAGAMQGRSGPARADDPGGARPRADDPACGRRLSAIRHRIAVLATQHEPDAGPIAHRTDLVVVTMLQASAIRRNFTSSVMSLPRRFFGHATQNPPAGWSRAAMSREPALGDPRHAIDANSTATSHQRLAEVVRDPDPVTVGGQTTHDPRRGIEQTHLVPCLDPFSFFWKRSRPCSQPCRTDNAAAARGQVKQEALILLFLSPLSDSSLLRSLEC